MKLVTTQVKSVHCSNIWLLAFDRDGCLFDQPIPLRHAESVILHSARSTPTTRKAGGRRTSKGNGKADRAVTFKDIFNSARTIEDWRTECVAAAESTIDPSSDRSSINASAMRGESNDDDDDDVIRYNGGVKASSSNENAESKAGEE